MRREHSYDSFLSIFDTSLEIIVQARKSCDIMKKGTVYCIESGWRYE